MAVSTLIYILTHIDTLVMGEGLAFGAWFLALGQN